MITCTACKNRYMSDEIHKCNARVDLASTIGANIDANNKRIAELTAKLDSSVPLKISVTREIKSTITDVTPAGFGPVEIPGVTIRPEVVAQATVDRALVASTIGIVTTDKDQLYATGTVMLSEGTDRANKIKNEFNDRPLIREASSDLVDIITAEKRMDYTKPLKDLRLDECGRLRDGDKVGRFNVDDHAMRQLLARAPKGLTAQKRANVNHWIGQSAPSATAVLRTRNPGQHRDVFACVTGKYQVFDVDSVARTLANTMPKDARMTYEYDRDSTKWRIQVDMPRPFTASESGVGQLMRVSLIVESGDNGACGMLAKYQIEKLRCKNATTVMVDKLMINRIHVGNDFCMVCNSMLTNASTAMHTFSGAWSAASVQTMVDQYDGTPLSARETFMRLVSHGHVTMPGVETDKEAVEILMSAWEQEPGDPMAVSQRNMIDAVTLAAHTNGFGFADGHQLEDQAGTLLFQNVRQLAGLTPEMRKAY